ncbi:DNA repair protein RadC [bacterium]|nr:MAG: DNA repair protein RadC [bacterium]
MNLSRHTRNIEIRLLEPIIGRAAAEELLSNNSLTDLFRLDRKSLLNVRHIGPARASAILALPKLLEQIGLRSGEKRAVTSSRDIFDLFRFSTGTKEREYFIVLSLNSRNLIISEETAAVGTINAVHISPADVLKSAVRCSAASIICIHNHPSGDPTPSPEDRDLTERIARASALLGVRFLDHLVITVSSYYSFSDSGEL